MGTKKKNFYAVKAGKKTGIFRTWEECKKNVNGYSGAIFKGFTTLEEANNFMNDSKNKSDDFGNRNFPIAYVDGSFNKTSFNYSYGIVIIFPDRQIKELFGKGKDRKAALERNVAGELLASMKAIEEVYNQGYRKICIKHDYEGIAKWANKDWEAKGYCSNIYIEFLRKYKDMGIIFEKVNAHTGVKYNERADELAKKALLI